MSASPLSSDTPSTVRFPSPVAPARWYYFDKGTEVGPLSENELRTRLRGGDLAPTTLVRRESVRGWTPAQDFTAFFPRQRKLAQHKYGYNPQHAGITRRVLATVIDLIVLFILVFGTSFYVGLLHEAFLGAEPSNLLLHMGDLLGILAAWLYFALMESSHFGGTLGKMILNLRVTSTQGARPSFLQTTGRTLIKVLILLGIVLVVADRAPPHLTPLVYLAGIVFVLLGSAFALFTRNRQTFHDVTANTYVVTDGER